MISPEEFLSAAPQTSVSGSSPWATRYAGEIRRIWQAAAAVDPRTLQKALGPSELGAACDRQVVGKMAGLPHTNHVSDPWPSIRGRALHSHAEGVFDHANQSSGPRFLTERRVTPMPAHPGTADLYDAAEQAVVDHKFLGASSLTKLRQEPSRTYRRQLFLYGWGYLQLGLPVRRVVLVAYPATAASLDTLYVHEWPFTTDDGQLTAEVSAELASTFTETEARTALADEVRSGHRSFMTIPATPDASSCYFCPFYRPEAARDGGLGCPGTATPTVPGAATPATPSA